MPGLDHGTAPPVEPADPATDARNARYGLAFFAAYLLLYTAFVLLDAFAPAVMDAVPLAGVNLAVLYGFGLIVGALVLALAYAFVCRSAAHGSNAREGRP